LLVAALAMPSVSLAQKEAPPPVGTPKDVRLPQKRSFSLDNGMRVTLVPFGTIPMAAVQLNVRAGSINESASEVRLANVVGDMLKEGTASRTAEQIANGAAGMGGALAVAIGADESTISSEVLSERTADMVRLIADVATNPKFPDAELARVKANIGRQIAIDRTVPQSIANEKFLEALYGDHPYGRTYPKTGQLEGLTIAQVRRFYADNFGAQRAQLFVVGVYDAAAVEHAIREAFSGWARGAPPANVEVPAGPTFRSLTLLDRADAPQSTINLGLRIIPPSSPDYIPMRVADYLVGGSFGSRITSNIREDKGYTYSPYSFINARQKSTYWQQSADVTTKDTGNSLKEIFAEIDKLSRNAPPQAEVTGMQNQLTGIFTLQTSSRSGIAERLAFADLHGVGDAYLTGYVRNIMSVTPEDVRRMTATYLRPDKMTLVVVGDKKTVEAQLAPWAPVVP
jgi:predicted Zn-dependent peptidase